LLILEHMFGLSRRRGEERAISWWPSWPSSSSTPDAVAPEEALRVADVWACVRCLADAAASLPLVPYRRLDAGRERLYTGRLPALLQRPAPAVTQSNLVGLMVTHLQLHGNAFVAKYRGSEGRIEQLGLLSPERVQVKLEAGQPVYTVFGPQGEKQVVGVDDVVHIKGAVSVDGLVGLSPIRQCALAISLAKGMGEFSEAFVRNGARPSGIIKLPQGANSMQLESFRARLEARHVGARQAHGIAILTGDVSWEALAVPADDMQFVEQRHLSTAEICRIFRVFPWMVGAEGGDSMTYSNTESQALAFVTYSLRPWLVAIEQAISADRDLCPGQTYVEFLIDGLLRADSKTRAEIYAMALDERGWMTRAEVRRLENLEPEPEREAA
jgi:HK97 family phage portal protein